MIHKLLIVSWLGLLMLIGWANSHTGFTRLAKGTLGDSFMAEVLGLAGGVGIAFLIFGMAAALGIGLRLVVARRVLALRATHHRDVFGFRVMVFTALVGAILLAMFWLVLR